MNATPKIKVQKTAASLRQQVLEGLRNAIVSGELPPGKRLTERELIEIMDVSRTVIREALRQLEAERLIEVIPNKGPVVRALTSDEAEDLYRIRAVLYGLAARIFVEQADTALVSELQTALAAVVAAYESGDAERVVETKTRFYEVMHEGTRSETLTSMLATLHARIWQWRALGLTHPMRTRERSLESIGNLRSILAATENRDPDAAEEATRREANQAAQEVIRLLASERKENAKQDGEELPQGLPRVDP
jgi:GntR family transcriptional regulator, trigonelline degradation regulator